MKKQEKTNLYHALYKLAGKIERLKKQGKEEEAQAVYSAIITITNSLGLNFTSVQIDRLKGEYNNSL